MARQTRRRRQRGGDTSVINRGSVAALRSLWQSRTTTPSVTPRMNRVPPAKLNFNALKEKLEKAQAERNLAAQRNMGPLMPKPMVNALPNIPNLPIVEISANPLQVTYDIKGNPSCMYNGLTITTQACDRIKRNVLINYDGQVQRIKDALRKVGGDNDGIFKILSKAEIKQKGGKRSTRRRRQRGGDNNQDMKKFIKAYFGPTGVEARTVPEILEDFPKQTKPYSPCALCSTQPCICRHPETTKLMLREVNKTLEDTSYSLKKDENGIPVIVNGGPVFLYGSREIPYKLLENERLLRNLQSAAIRGGANIGTAYRLAMNGVYGEGKWA